MIYEYGSIFKSFKTNFNANEVISSQTYNNRSKNSGSTLVIEQNHFPSYDSHEQFLPTLKGKVNCRNSTSHSFVNRSFELLRMRSGLFMSFHMRSK